MSATRRAFAGLLAAPVILAGCGDTDFRHDQSTEADRTICVDAYSHVRQENLLCDGGHGRWYIVPYGQWIPAVGQRVSGFTTVTKTKVVKVTKTKTKTPTSRRTR